MKCLTAICFTLILSVQVHAALTKESFVELLKMADAQSVLDNMVQKLDAKMEEQFDHALTNRETPEGLAYAESFRQKMRSRFNEKITLPQLAGECLAESGQELSQEEVDALIAFCQNPVGRSALIKVSPLMRNFEVLAQKHVIQFRMEPEQSMAVAMQQLKEITFKSLRIPDPVAPSAPVLAPDKRSASSSDQARAEKTH